MLRFIAHVGRGHFEEEKIVEEEKPIVIPEGYFQEEDAELDKWRQKISQIRASGLAKRAQFRQEQAELQRQLTAAQNKLTHRRDTIVVTTSLTEYARVTKEVRAFLVPGVVAALQAKLCLHVHAMCVHQEQIRLAKNDHQEIIWWYEDMVKTLRQEQADKEMELMNELVTLKVEISTLIDEHSVMHSTHALDNVQELAAMAGAAEPVVAGGRRRSSTKLLAPDKAALAARRRSSFRNMSKEGIIMPMLKVPSPGNAIGRVNSKSGLARVTSKSRMARVTSKNRMSITSLTAIAMKEGTMEDEEEDADKEDKNNDNNQEDSNESSVLAAPRAGGQARSPRPQQQDRPSRPVRVGIQRTRSRSLTSMKRENGRGGKRPSHDGKALAKSIDDSDIAESSTGGLARANSRSDSPPGHYRTRRQTSITPTKSREEENDPGSPTTNIITNNDDNGKDENKVAIQSATTSNDTKPKASAPRRGRDKGPAIQRTRSKSLTSMKDDRRAGKKPPEAPKAQDDGGVLLRGFGDLPPIDLNPKFVGKRQPMKPRSVSSSVASSDDDEYDDYDGPAAGWGGKFRNWKRAVQDRFGEK